MYRLKWQLYIDVIFILANTRKRRAKKVYQICHTYLDRKKIILRLLFFIYNSFINDKLQLTTPKKFSESLSMIKFVIIFKYFELHTNI